MIDISYIMGFIGVAVGLIIGILIYSEVEAAIDWPDATANADDAAASHAEPCYAAAVTADAATNGSDS